MAHELRRFAFVTGLICIALGLVELVLGRDAVPNGQNGDATADSAARFSGAILIGFGLAWLWGARSNPLPVRLLRALAGILLRGAAARVVSLLVSGRPHWFSLVQLGVETVVPVVVLVLAARTEQGPVRAAG